MKNKITLGETQVDADLKFFILEDTPVYQKRIIACLRALGFTGKPVFAPSIKDAKSMIRDNTPDIFFCDWNLPDGFGIDFLRELRRTERFKNTPVVMVTTMDDPSNILEAINDGADGYVVKPYETTDLEDKIAFAVEKRSTIRL